MILIIAGVFALIAIVSVVLLSSKKNTTTTTDNTQNNGATTGSGGVTTTTPSPTTTGRDFVVRQDPAQPFTSLNPRGVEPLVVKTSTSGKFQDYNKAVADGLIPDQDGLYHQVVDPNYDPRKTASLDISDTTFLQNNYPDAAAVVAGQTPGQIALNNSDPIVTVNNSNVSSTIQLVPNFSGPSFKQGSSNQSDMTAYLNALSNATKPFDIVYDNKLQNIFSTDNISDLNAAKAQVQSVMDNMAKLTVPAKFLGLAQAYYQGYQVARDLIDDTIGTSGSNQAGVLAAATRMTTDVNRFSQVSDWITNDINIAARLSQ